MNKQKTHKKDKQLRILTITLFLLGLAACNSTLWPDSGSASSDSGSPSCQADAVEEAVSFADEVDDQAADAVMARVGGGWGVRRGRRVQVDSAALRRTLRRNRGRVLQVEFFPHERTEVRIEKIENFSENNLVMTGSVAGDEGSAVTVVLKDEVALFRVQFGDGRHLETRHRGRGRHEIQEMEAETDEACLTAPADEDREDVALDTNAVPTSLQPSPVIDMLVAYTPGARAEVGGTTAMMALIQSGIADTNRAFSTSGVNLQVRLVGTLEVSQNDTNNFSADLSALKSKTDGRWDEVHAWRSRVGADQVTLVGVYPNNSVNGIGYIKSGLASAFTVVKVSAFRVYTFSHELGHNVGLNHTDGYVNASGRFRTVMAYGSYPRIPRFSNPLMDYNSYLTGDTDQNSAAILNRDGSFISALVAAITPTPNSPTDEPPPAEEPGRSCP